MRPQYTPAEKLAEAKRCLQELGQPITPEAILEMIEYGEEFDAMADEAISAGYWQVNEDGSVHIRHSGRPN